MSQEKVYDLVIVGAGISAGVVALQLAKKKKKVLILEAGPPIPTSREEYMEHFYNAQAKVPESPYPPDVMTTVEQKNFNVSRPSVLQISEWRDPRKSYLTYSKESKHAFASTYERIGGGTTWHWLGTCLRFFPEDFKMKSTFGVEVDWPIDYKDVQPFYEKAEHLIGVSADKAAQERLGIPFKPGYEYPMPEFTPTFSDDSYTDKLKGHKIDDKPLWVTPTPQGRNSIPHDSRRTCAGNTNCIPICPIQAKYDATVTLNDALQTGYVEILYKSAAYKVQVDEKGNQVTGILYKKYHDNIKGSWEEHVARGKQYLLAAHAIETPRLLLNSACKPCPDGVANSSGMVGRNLMDHVTYLAWALADKPLYPFRGPLSTSGIETLRTGEFRKDRAAFRIEIGNEGWNWAIGDPNTTTGDFVFGTNKSKLNQKKEVLFGAELVQTLNKYFTREMRLGFLIEQSPEADNRVQISKTERDHLGIPRAELTYNLSNYTKKGFVAAKKVASEIFNLMGATEYTRPPDPPTKESATTFEFEGSLFKFYGAGHIVGTYRMGDSGKDSVVNTDQRSWDHDNLYMVGSGTFPTVATANPTLTIVALAFKTGEAIIKALQ